MNCDENNIIKLDQTIIIRSYDDKEFNVVKVSRDQKIGRTRVNLSNLASEEYGSVFELMNRKLVKVSEDDQEKYNSRALNDIIDMSLNIDNGDITHHNESNNDSDDENNQHHQNHSKIIPIRGDNSFYVDTNTAQKLKDVDIHRLKASGLSGEEIIQTLIQNSGTFSSKTEFAQEKWIKRKEKKYKRRIRVYKCTPSLLCQAYFTKSREKICNLRQDTLAQIVSQSGIHSGGRVMVIESMIGLVVGALAYRMNGKGRIIAVYGGQQPHLDLVHSLNLDLQSISIIETVPSNELGPAAKDVYVSGFAPQLVDDTSVIESSMLVDDNNNDNNNSNNNSRIVDQENNNMENDVVPDIFNSAHLMKDSNNNHISEINNNEDVVENDVNNNKKQFKQKKLKCQINPIINMMNSTFRNDDIKAKLRLHLRQGVDSLIIACKYRPLPILKQAIQLLTPSSPFVIFHEFQEPLVDCYMYLQQSGLALRLVLSDTWMREYQTLAGRTRPDMFMSTSGGFLLYGIYIGNTGNPNNNIDSNSNLKNENVENDDNIDDIQLDEDKKANDNNNQNGNKRHKKQKRS
eukprot:gene10132-13630_t